MSKSDVGDDSIQAGRALLLCRLGKPNLQTAGLALGLQSDVAQNLGRFKSQQKHVGEAK